MTVNDFKFDPENVFKDASAYPDPATEEATREQFSKPLEQLRDYINKTLAVAVKDNAQGIEDINVNGQGVSSIPNSWIDENLV